MNFFVLKDTKCVSHFSVLLLSQNWWYYFVGLSIVASKQRSRQSVHLSMSQISKRIEYLKKKKKK